MKTKVWRNASFLSSIIAANIVLWSAVPAFADSPKVVQIEEQWELSIGVPDAGRSAPQATMVMSPTGNLDSTYFLFTLNCRNLPDYQPGGVQVQRWEGDSVANSGTGSVAEPLSQSEDTVSWTQRVTLHEEHTHVRSGRRLVRLLGPLRQRRLTEADVRNIAR